MLQRELAVTSGTRYLSYCLFTKLRHEPARWYDPHEHDHNRYWFNLPALIVANALCYPGYVMRIHVDPQIEQHPLFPMLAGIERRGLIQVVTCHHPFQHTEPTFWRLQPVWQESFDVVLCRDVDSLPTTRELQATLAFVHSNFLMQSIRTHPAHNTGHTRVLAGLCGFRGGIRHHLDVSFDEYYRMANGQWGTDQAVLARYFVDRLGHRFLRECFLDTCIHSFPGQMREHLPGSRAGKIAQKVYDAVDVSHVPAEIRGHLDAITSWPGQPVDTRGEAMRRLLALEIDAARALREHMSADQAARDFYRL
jgi:hypothetical protein